MADFVIAGHAACRNFAKLEMLADRLSHDLPNFNVSAPSRQNGQTPGPTSPPSPRCRRQLLHGQVTKVMVEPGEWEAWLLETQRAQKWARPHVGSPLAYRVLGTGNTAGLPVGEVPTLSPYDRFVGDHAAFAEMAAAYYGVVAELSEAEVDATVNGNLASVAAQAATAARHPGGVTTVAMNCATDAVAYQLVWALARGGVFPGSVALRLLDAPEHAARLEGLAMELADCALPTLAGVVVTADPKVAMAGADVAVLTVGDRSDPGSPALSGDALAAVVALGRAVGAGASAGARVVLAGRGAEVAGSVLLSAAGWGTERAASVSVLAGVPQLRAHAAIAAKLNTRCEARELHIGGGHVHGVMVWDASSAEPVPDASRAVVSGFGAVVGAGAAPRPLVQLLQEPSWLEDTPESRTVEGELLPESLHGWIWERAALLESRRPGQQPAMLVARALASHLRLLAPGATAADTAIVPAGLYSGAEPHMYAATPHIFLTMPAIPAADGLAAAPGFALTDAVRDRIAASGAALSGHTRAALAEAGLPDPIVIAAEAEAAARKAAEEAAAKKAAEEAEAAAKKAAEEAEAAAAAEAGEAAEGADAPAADEASTPASEDPKEAAATVSEDPKDGAS